MKYQTYINLLILITDLLLILDAFTIKLLTPEQTLFAILGLALLSYLFDKITRDDSYGK